MAQGLWNGLGEKIFPISKFLRTRLSVWKSNQVIDCCFVSGVIAPKRLSKYSRCMGMLTLFQDLDVVLLEEYLLSGWTVNSKAYCETLLELRRAIQNKRRGKLSKKIVLRQDNVRVHTSKLTTCSRKISNGKYFLIQYILQTYAFPALKYALGGKRHATIAGIQENLRYCFAKQAVGLYNLESVILYYAIQNF